MQLFYIPEISGSTITPDSTESKHMIKVLRLTNGDIVKIVDGKGGYYEAEIIDANPKKCLLSVLKSKQNFGKRDFWLHIAIAPTKNNDRFEWFLEKATELGIDEITPILTERSERKVIKPERLQKVMIAAMKQSLKAYLPKLNLLTPAADLIRSATNMNKFIAHCAEGNKRHLKDVIIPKEKCLVLIGPEGDFSDDEIELAKKLDFSEISLGNARLRTETAGVAACHIVNLANE